MNALPALAGTLALSVLLLGAHAQAPATPHDNPTPAKPTVKAAATTQGSKRLGQKMVQKSKPTDTVLPRKVIKK